MIRRLKIAEVAVLAGVSVATLRRHVYGILKSPSLEGLPAPCVRGGRKRMLWLSSDIEAWLRSQSTIKGKTGK